MTAQDSPAHDTFYRKISELFDKQEETLSFEINSDVDQEKISIVQTERDRVQLLREQVDLLSVAKQKRQ